MDNSEKVQKNSKDIIVTLRSSIILAIILIGIVALFFFHLYTQEALMHADLSQLEIKYDFHDISKNICNSSDSSDTSKIICNSIDTSQLQYIVAQIDLEIDKFSQWTGFWLSIISCILAIFTLIQAFTNYKSNKDAEKRIDNALKGFADKFQQEKIEFKRKFNFERNRFRMIARNMESSAFQNRLSCISACISSFPDVFSLTPTIERRNFTRSFLSLLNAEYSEYVYYMRQVIDCNTSCTGNSVILDLSREVNYVYIVWCDISIAINRAMYDIPARIQDDVFNDLRDLLSTAISDYHRLRINSANVVGRMSEIQEALELLINTLQHNRHDAT